MREKITPPKIAALGLAPLSAALTAHPEGGQWTGLLLALAAAPIYIVLTKNEMGQPVPSED